MVGTGFCSEQDDTMPSRFSRKFCTPEAPVTPSEFGGVDPSRILVRVIDRTPIGIAIDCASGPPLPYLARNAKAASVPQPKSCPIVTSVGSAVAAASGARSGKAGVFGAAMVIPAVGEPTDASMPVAGATP